MQHWEKATLPHAVYRFYDKGGAAIYIGYSWNPFGRLGHHFERRMPWITQVVNITVEWFPTWLDAARAEAGAILQEHPRYNIRTVQIDAVDKERQRKERAVPRGDGVHCPKCGATKTRQRDAYCKPCAKEYRATLRAQAKAAHLALVQKNADLIVQALAKHTE